MGIALIVIMFLKDAHLWANERKRSFIKPPHLQWIGGKRSFEATSRLKESKGFIFIPYDDSFIRIYRYCPCWT